LSKKRKVSGSSSFFFFWWSMRPLVFFLFLLVALSVCHERLQAPHACGNDLLKQTPWFLEHSASFEGLSEEVRLNRHLFERTNTVLRIPVVWHVLTNSPTNRVSRDKILAEMGWLNDWFSAKNKYYNTSDMFAAVVAGSDDLKIRFELATKDPLGNAFDGVRYITSTQAESCSSSSTANFYTSQGGADIWDSSLYFNVYTCKITNGFSGFAFYPSYSPYATDGCVMDYSKLGSSYSSGATLAHEAGHWLGLDHTFEGDSCSLDDKVADTPNTDTNGLNWLLATDPCNIQDSTTAFVRCGNTVMVRNVMEYNYAPCNQYFTKQQASRMRGYLLNPSSPRSYLTTSPALAPSCPTYDCFGKSCGPDGCGGICGTCSSLSACGGNGNCYSSIPKNIDCPTAEGLTQSTTGYSVTKVNTGVVNDPFSCGK
jgi:hypothetical protein